MAGLGLALVSALLIVAKPGNVIAMARGAHLRGLAPAFGWAVGLTLLRGVRLRLLAGDRLGTDRGVAVAAAAQFAVGVMPLRLGDLALVPLLALAGVPGTVRGLSFLLLVRILDAGAVIAWGTLDALATGGQPTLTILAMVGLAGGLAVMAWAATSALSLVAKRWRRRFGWRRTVLRQSLEVRRELRGLGRSPARAVVCVVTSMLVWATIWAGSVALLRAMGLDWPAGAVLGGVIGAAVASSLPVNVIGTFGTQEAGWAAALVGAGVSPGAALSAGFASHLWTLVFQTALGVSGLIYLALRQSGNSESSLRASLKNLLKSLRLA